jgi:hypothetical protein
MLANLRPRQRPNAPPGGRWGRGYPCRETPEMRNLGTGNSIICASVGQAQHCAKVSLPPAHTGLPYQFWWPGPTRHACSLLAWPRRYTTLADRGACPATSGGLCLCSCQHVYPDDPIGTFPGCATRCILSCIACSCIPRPHSQGSILFFPQASRGNLYNHTLCFSSGRLGRCCGSCPTFWPHVWPSYPIQFKPSYL